MGVSEARRIKTLNYFLGILDRISTSLIGGKQESNFFSPTISNCKVPVKLLKLFEPVPVFIACENKH